MNDGIQTRKNENGKMNLILIIILLVIGIPLLFGILFWGYTKTEDANSKDIHFNMTEN